MCIVYMYILALIIVDFVEQCSVPGVIVVSFSNDFCEGFTFNKTWLTGRQYLAEEMLL